jgi:HEAT repeat protein
MRAFRFVMLFSLFLLCAVQHGAAQEKEPVYDGKPVSEWIARLKDKDDQVRLKAAMSLRHLGPQAKAAVPALMDSLNDRNVSIRQESAFALLRIGAAAKPAIPALVQALNDKDFYVRFGSTIALADFGVDAPAAVPALTQMLKGPDAYPDAELMVQAARALWRMGEKKEEALAALITVLEHKNWTGAASAAPVLGEMGPAAKAAVPGLLKALDYPWPVSPGRCGERLERRLAFDQMVREALKKIEPKAVKKADRPGRR